MPDTDARGALYWLAFVLLLITTSAAHANEPTDRASFQSSYGVQSLAHLLYGVSTGDRYAALALASRLAEGRAGAPRRPARAAQWYSRAASLGQPGTPSLQYFGTLAPLLAGISQDNDPGLPPVARFEATPGRGGDAQSVSFNALASQDDRGIIAWSWNFGTNARAEGPMANHRFAAAGRYAVILSLMDSDGHVVHSVQEVLVGADHEEPGPDGLLSGFNRDTVLGGLNDPVNLVALPDGTMLVLEKRGRLWQFDPTELPATPTPVLDLASVQNRDERGAASLALDPAFVDNGYLYLYYTRQEGSGGRNRLARFTLLDGRATIDSEVLVWEDNEPASSCCHFGGGLDFGPDGMLYLTTGDEFDGAQAQDPTRAGGKVIRVDPRALDTSGPWVRGAGNTHIVPADNPLADGAGPNLDEIWALGLRNPFRAHWDLPGNRFFIGEVGGNDQASAQEDLHLGRAGANFGWPACEGPCSNPAYDDPIHSYAHTGVTPNGGAIAAGLVYRASGFPEGFQGTFFFADYVTGEVRYLGFDASGQVVSTRPFATGTGAPVALEIDAEGALLAVDYAGGRILRYTYDSGDNRRPVIVSASITPDSGAAPLNVSFTASATDPDGDALQYRWQFGDGNEASGATVGHTYNAEGRYQVVLRVSDGALGTLSSPLTVQAGTPPVVLIEQPLDGRLFRGGDVIELSAQILNSGAGASAGYRYEWDVDFTHNAHVHPSLNTSEPGGSFQIPTSGHDYHDDTGYRVRLQVTDSNGLRGSDTVRIRPEKIDLNLASVPAGLDLFVDGLPITTPASYDTLVNFTHRLAAPQSICRAGEQLSFSGWSDGGARAHSVDTGSQDLLLSASYLSSGACAELPASGLVARFETDQGLLSNGARLLAWQDLSGRGNHLNNLLGEPQLQPDTLQGYPVVAFDGQDDLMQRIGTLQGLPSGNAARSMALVARYDSTGYGGASYGNTDFNQSFGLVVNPVGRLMVQGWGVSNDFASARNGTNAGWLMQSARFDGQALEHYLDGESIDIRSHAYATVPQSMVLGAEIDGTPLLDMQVAAWLVYDRALSPGEMQQLHTYLQTKYLGAPATSSLAERALKPMHPDLMYQPTRPGKRGVSPGRSPNQAIDLLGSATGVILQPDSQWTSQQRWRDYVLALEYRWPDALVAGIDAAQTSARRGALWLHLPGQRAEPDGGLRVAILEGSTGDLHAPAVGTRFHAPAVAVEDVGRTWNHAGGRIWDMTGHKQWFTGPRGVLHRYGWDTNWQDVEGFRGLVALENPAGRWNQLVIEAEGKCLRLILNGTPILQAENVQPSAGFVALQTANAPLSLRRWTLHPPGTVIAWPRH